MHFSRIGPPDRTHPLLVWVDPIDLGDRSSEGMVASLHLDFSRYCKDPVDLSRGDPFTLVVDWNNDGDNDLIINQFGYA
jgi:hypothetical protein